MSQPRMRKASTAGDVPRVRSTFVKASGDSSVNPNRQQQPRSRSKNNKLPKNIRYDLDSALVGLCDVWFEDIKPHLIRNNIKVHIHGDGPCPASGDHKRMPPGAPGCSHLDPGAASDHHQLQCVNFADSYVKPRTASKAPWPRPPAASPCPASKLQLLLQSMNAQQEYKNTNAPIKKINRPPHQRHNRLAQSYVIQNDTRSKSPFIGSRRRPNTAPYRTKNKGSQTHFRYFPSPALMEEKGTQTLRPVRRQTSARVSTNVPAASFDRCPGKTTLVTRPRTRPNSCTESKSPLLRSNPIRNEEKRKVVEVLYYSPNSSKFNSSVTLLSLKGKRKRKGTGKIPPWR